MGFRVVREGNAFYEIDEDCVSRKEKNEENDSHKTDMPGREEGVQESRRNGRKETA